MPIRAASAPWPRWPNEVSRTSLTPASEGSSLIARARASPSISGIFMSRMARSKPGPLAAACRSAASAFAPDSTAVVRRPQ